MHSAGQAVDFRWGGRQKRNVILYLWIYGLLGAVTGITNNAMMSYYQIVAPKLVTGYNLYGAIGSILLTGVIMLIHRWGFKKILLIAPPITVITLVVSIMTTNVPLIIIMSIISGVSIGIYDFLYPIMFAVYIPRERQTRWMTYVMIDNLLWQSVLTFLGGKAVVYFFGKLQGISYSQASVLSAHQETMHGTMLAHYTTAYKDVILIAVALAALAFLFALAIKDRPVDYRMTASAQAAQKTKWNLQNYRALANKTVFMWLLYMVLVGFGASIVVPYIPIYLNNYLHIARGVTATINTIQTAAMFVGYMAAPFLERKLGTIVSIVATMLMCTPLMIIMANGRLLGSGMMLAVIVCIVLFLRSGIANAAMPVQQTLQMAMVDKDHRPAFSAILSLVSAITGILSGLFCTFVLFTSLEGYAVAYYIAGGLYLIGSIFILIVLKEKYNDLTRPVTQQATTQEEIVENQSVVTDD